MVNNKFRAGWLRKNVFFQSHFPLFIFQGKSILISRNQFNKVSAAQHFEVMHNIDTVKPIYYNLFLEYYNKFHFSKITFNGDSISLSKIFFQIKKLRNYIKTIEVLDGELSLLKSTSSCSSASKIIVKFSRVLNQFFICFISMPREINFAAPSLRVPQSPLRLKISKCCD